MGLMNMVLMNMGLIKMGMINGGLMKMGLMKMEKEKINKWGYNINGFDRQGFNRDWHNINGYNSSGYNRDRYNINGYNVRGLNRRCNKRKALEKNIPGSGLKKLTPQQMLARLPILLAQIKARNNSQEFKNEIRQLLYSLYSSKKISKTVCKNLIATI